MADNMELQTLADAKHIRLVKRGRWEFVMRKGVCGIVGIVAVTDDSKMILIEQERVPVNARVIEIPAGLAGDSVGHETEDLAVAAERELLEETGYAAASFEHLTEGTSSAGLTDESITLFRARGLKKLGPAKGDGGEDITLHEIPLTEVDAWLDSRRRGGTKIDLKVYAALYFARQS